jgi:acetolactate synthase-1/2/3 large subunit
VPARRVGLDQVEQAVADSWRADGPQVVVVSARLAMFAPTHLTG